MIRKKVHLLNKSNNVYDTKELFKISYHFILTSIWTAYTNITSNI